MPTKVSKVRNSENSRREREIIFRIQIRGRRESKLERILRTGQPSFSRDRFNARQFDVRPNLTSRCKRRARSPSNDGPWQERSRRVDARTVLNRNVRDLISPLIRRRLIVFTCYFWIAPHILINDVHDKTRNFLLSLLLPPPFFLTGRMRMSERITRGIFPDEKFAPDAFQDSTKHFDSTTQHASFFDCRGSRVPLRNHAHYVKFWKIARSFEKSTHTYLFSHAHSSVLFTWIPFFLAFIRNTDNKQMQAARIHFTRYFSCPNLANFTLLL